MLLTLDEGKSHLEITHYSQDDLIEQKIGEASAIVLDYLKVPSDTWQDVDGFPDGVPAVVRAATKLVLGALMENREGADNLPQPISQAVKDLLRRLRDPAMA